MKESPKRAADRLQRWWGRPAARTLGLALTFSALSTIALGACLFDDGTCTTGLRYSVVVAVWDGNGHVASDELAQVEYRVGAEGEWQGCHYVGEGAHHVPGSGRVRVNWACGYDEAGAVWVRRVAEGLEPHDQAFTIEMDDRGCHVVTQITEFTLPLESEP